MNIRTESFCSLVLAVSALPVSAAEPVYIMPYGHAVNTRGEVVAEGLEVSGTQGDQVVGANGRIYSRDELRVDSSGKLRARDGTALRQREMPTRRGGNGVPTVPIPGIAKNGTQSVAPGGATEPTAISSDYKGPGIEMIIGGQSEDGITRRTTLPIRN